MTTDDASAATEKPVSVLMINFPSDSTCGYVYIHPELASTYTLDLAAWIRNRIGDEAHVSITTDEETLRTGPIAVRRKLVDGEDQWNDAGWVSRMFQLLEPECVAMARATPLILTENDTTTYYVRLEILRGSHLRLTRDALELFCGYGTSWTVHRKKDGMYKYIDLEVVVPGDMASASIGELLEEAAKTMMSQLRLYDPAEQMIYLEHYTITRFHASQTDTALA